METALKLLKQNGLRKTQIREAILDVFLTQKTALSHSEVEQLFLGKFDRVTVYRTLKTFDEKGLIHRVIDDGAVVKYAVCEDTCDEHQHHYNHVHFKCEKCKKTVCIHDSHITNVALPQGFVGKEYQLLVMGVCDKCS